MDNKKVAIILAEGFEEIEALGTIDILRRGGVVCDLITIDNKIVKGSHNIRVDTDKSIDEVIKKEYDMLILPGGKLGTENLNNNIEVIEWIKEFNEDNKLIALICAAPTILKTAGIEKNRSITSYPDNIYKDILKDSNYIDNKLVVVDNNIITSRGPATTFIFAYTILEVLGIDTNTLKNNMLYKG